MGFLKTDQSYELKRNRYDAYHGVNAQHVLFLLDHFGVVGEETERLKRTPEGEVRKVTGYLLSLNPVEGFDPGL